MDNQVVMGIAQYQKKNTSGGKEENEQTNSFKVREEKGVVNEKEENEKEEDEDDEDDEDDDDYDPTKKDEKLVQTGRDGEHEEEEEEDDDDDSSDDESLKIPDYSKIESNISLVKTRAQRLNEKKQKESKFIGSFETDLRGLVKDNSVIDVDAIFSELKENKNTGDLAIASEDGTEEKEGKISKNVANTKLTKENFEGNDISKEPKQIKIQVNYTFAGKLVTETKLVDRDSEEAKAYLNSVSSITSTSTAGSDGDGVDEYNENGTRKRRSQVKVIREDPFTKEKVELRIKLKRPSLIDKFIQISSNKKMKLSTLEKSRLDWASFVDKRKIGDELKKHNKAGYLDKQAFLGRVDVKKDALYQEAKEKERRVQNQLNSK